MDVLHSMKLHAGCFVCTYCAIAVIYMPFSVYSILCELSRYFADNDLLVFHEILTGTATSVLNIITQNT